MPADGGVEDGGVEDGGPVDGGPEDGGPVDGGVEDGGVEDGGPVDGGQDGGNYDKQIGEPCPNGISDCDPATTNACLSDSQSGTTWCSRSCPTGLGCPQDFCCADTVGDGNPTDFYCKLPTMCAGVFHCTTIKDCPMGRTCLNKMCIRMTPPGGVGTPCPNGIGDCTQGTCINHAAAQMSYCSISCTRDYDCPMYYCCKDTIGAGNPSHFFCVYPQLCSDARQCTDQSHCQAHEFCHPFTQTCQTAGSMDGGVGDNCPNGVGDCNPSATDHCAAYPDGGIAPICTKACSLHRDCASPTCCVSNLIGDGGYCMPESTCPQGRLGALCSVGERDCHPWDTDLCHIQADGGAYCTVKCDNDGGCPGGQDGGLCCTDVAGMGRPDDLVCIKSATCIPPGQAQLGDPCPRGSGDCDPNTTDQCYYPLTPPLTPYCSTHCDKQLDCPQGLCCDDPSGFGYPGDFICLKKAFCEQKGLTGDPCPLGYSSDCDTTYTQACMDFLPRYCSNQCSARSECPANFCCSDIVGDGSNANFFCVKPTDCPWPGEIGDPCPHDHGRDCNQATTSNCIADLKQFCSKPCLTFEQCDLNHCCRELPGIGVQGQKYCLPPAFCATGGVYYGCDGGVGCNVDGGVCAKGWSSYCTGTCANDGGCPADYCCRSIVDGGTPYCKPAEFCN